MNAFFALVIFSHLSGQPEDFTILLYERGLACQDAKEDFLQTTRRRLSGITSRIGTSASYVFHCRKRAPARRWQPPPAEMRKKLQFINRHTKPAADFWAKSESRESLKGTAAATLPIDAC
jgi:hypothetical protein